MQTMDLPTTKMIGGIEGGIGWVIFNHPERRNAVCLEMWQAIPLIMDRLEADPAVRVIVLRGTGGQAQTRRHAAWLNTLPGRAPVAWPSRQTTAPFTITASIPRAGVMGAS